MVVEDGVQPQHHVEAAAQLGHVTGPAQLSHRRPLELAYTWARSVARQSLAFAPEAFDIAEVHARLENAFTALSRASTVRRCLSTARNGVDQAHAEMDALVAEVDGALCRLRSASEASVSVNPRSA